MLIAPAKYISENRLAGFLLLTLLSAVTIWSLDGLVYFLLVLSKLRIFQSPDQADEAQVRVYTFIMPIISACINGLMVASVVTLFVRYSAQFTYAWVKWLLLVAILFIGSFVIDTLLYTQIAALLTHKSLVFSQSKFTSLLFNISDVGTGTSFYFLITREYKRSKKISEQAYQLLLLKELKAKAELEALQAKINPHFLYNSLNSIASLVHIDPDKAEQMVLLLSKFFRYSTSLKSQYWNTIANEVEMVCTYLEVEQVRFDDRLTYRVQYDDPDLKHYVIPCFILQPLVENAVKHGIAKLADGGELEVRIGKEAGQLVIAIHDNGPAFPESLNTGYGLQSTQDKLRLLCGESARLELHNGAYKHVKLYMKLSRETAIFRESNTIITQIDHADSL